MISHETIEKIRRKADICDVISKYIDIAKKGRNYVCVCPFHDDHDPSMSISTDKQIYKCFVCGAGGNVFSFVQNYEKVSFEQAVEKVGDMVGVHVSASPAKAIDPRLQKGYDLLNNVVSYCSYELSQLKDENIINYLNKRDLNPDIIKYFAIGYNNSGGNVCNFLLKKGFSQQEIVSFNVGLNTAKGLIDVNNNRIVFPIDDIDGHYIGFTARTLDPNNNSKYINTSETLIFKKGYIVYNGSRSKSSARRKNNIFICEGVMDCIAFYKAGIDNVVATLGTACTKEQLLLIKSIVNHITLAYDGDLAGQKAIYKAGKLALSLGIKVDVFNNNTNLDPDELYLQKGKESLYQMALKPKNWLAFVYDFFKAQYDLTDYNQKKSFALNVYNEIKTYNDTLDQQAFLKLLSQETGFTFQLENNENKNVSYKINEVNNVSINKTLTKLDKLQMQIINQLMLDNNAIALYKKEYNFLPGDVYQQIAKKICKKDKDDKLEYAALLDLFDSQDVKDKILQIANDETLTQSYNENVFRSTFKQIEIEIKKDSIRQYKDKMAKEFDPNVKIQLEQTIQKIYQDINILNKE